MGLFQQPPSVVNRKSSDKFHGPGDAPSTPSVCTHPPGGYPCWLALTPGRPPQFGGLRSGDGLARGRGAPGRPPRAMEFYIWQRIADTGH
jgi:hypothetical protein